MRYVCIALALVSAVLSPALAGAPAPMTRAHYRVLPGGHREGQPFDVVDFTYGPQTSAGPGKVFFWQLDVRPQDEPASEPLFQLRASTLRDPLADSPAPLEIFKYQLRIPATKETYEYRDANQPGRAYLPQWGDFTRCFLPQPARATGRQQGVPHSCEYLGQVLTLREVTTGVEWTEWNDVKVLDLDGELLIGTGRTVKDAEGHRLPQTPERQNYTYIPWTQEDYDTMIAAGMNYFGIVAGLEAYVRSQPVFYRGQTGKQQYPADLYRSNYVGPTMFMDEPTCIMVNNKTVHTTLKYFTDAAALITKRVRSEYEHGIYGLEKTLRDQGVAFGDMRLVNWDFPTWETRYETAFYQLLGGGSGIVHEGRYQLGEFNEFAKASTGFDRVHMPEEMFQYYYAFLRGAARHFDKDWGTSIYGQADPKLSPLAMNMAYDMGARYLWYWTSDHDHHMPWPEQLELTRTLKKHIADHRRPSIRKTRPVLDKAIVIPFGYFLVLESPTTRKNCWDLWWVRELDAEGKNESSQRYRRLMQNAWKEIHKAYDAGESFDITVDNGKDITGYRKVVRVTDE